jgi:hypothetical protein
MATAKPPGLQSKINHFGRRALKTIFFFSPARWSCNSFAGGKPDERSGKNRAHREMAAARQIHMRRLLAGAGFLLDLSLWLYDLFGLYGRKFLGHDL